MFFKKSKTVQPSIWKNLSSQNQLDDILEASHDKVQVIFKHSTTCSISAMAKNRVESAWNYSEEQVDLHYLDLLSFRPVSNLVAEKLNVKHESPQMIVLKNGKVVLHESHGMINAADVASAIN